MIVARMTHYMQSKKDAIDFCRAFSRHFTCLIYMSPVGKSRTKLYAVVRPVDEAPNVGKPDILEIPDSQLEKFTITQ
jgi:hypothetical protein